MTTARTGSEQFHPDDAVSVLEREVGELAARCDVLRGQLADAAVALAAAHARLGDAADTAYARGAAEVGEVQRWLVASRAAESDAIRRADAAEAALRQLTNSKVFRWSRLPRRVYGKLRRTLR